MSQSLHWLVSQLLTGVLILCSLLAYSQDTLSTESKHPDYITYEKSVGRWQAQHKGRVLSQEELYMVLNNDNESADYVGKHKTKNTIGAVLGGFGGAFIGFPLGMAIAGAEPPWVMALAGVGILAIGFPIAISGDRDLRKGVEAYNHNLGDAAHSHNPILRVGGQSHGVGLALRF